MSTNKDLLWNQMLAEIPVVFFWRLKTSWPFFLRTTVDGTNPKSHHQCCTKPCKWWDKLPDFCLPSTVPSIFKRWMFIRTNLHPRKLTAVPLNSWTFSIGKYSFQPLIFRGELLVGSNTPSTKKTGPLTYDKLKNQNKRHSNTSLVTFPQA